MDSQILEIDVFVLQIFYPFGKDEFEESLKDYWELVEEISNLPNGLQIDINDVGKVSVEISCDSDKELIKQLIRNEYREYCYYSVLCFSSTIKFTPQDYPEVHRDYPKTSLDKINAEVTVEHIIDDYEQRILEIIIISNLCRVGSLDLYKVFTFQNGKFREFGFECNIDKDSLLSAVNYAKTINFPQIRKIKFEKVLSWINTNQRNGFSKGFSKNPVGRALCALTQVLNSINDGNMRLVWAMVGLEALYVKGKVSVTEQVKEKIQTLLGKAETHKKKINEMYEHRSRFIHGDIDFPGIHCFDDDEFSDFKNKQWKTADLATAILIATLQEIIIRDWSSLEFSYSVLEDKVS